MDRGREFWTPEPLFGGDTVFILGGGPSLRDFDIERLRGEKVIAINSSAKLCPFADVLFFFDRQWFEQNRALVETWPGLAVTPSRQAKAALPDKLLRVERRGRSSGHGAVSLAIALGAATVVLLGYDMRRVDGRSHHHDDYSTADDKVYSHDFLVHFSGWNEAARRAGVAVLNATPQSALTEFPMADIDDILAERAAA